MTDQPTCQVCNAPTGDGAWLCNADTTTLEVVLAELPTLLDELSVTLTRQDRISRVSSTGRRAAPERPDDRPEDEPHLGVKEQGSPMHLGAAAAFDDANDTLGTWACHIAEHRGAPFDLPAGRSQAARCALWLLRHMASVRLDEAVGELFDEVSYAHRQVERVINRPADRVYAGPCHADVTLGEGDTLRVERCEFDLYARWGSDTITCDGWNADSQGCRTVHTLGARRAFLRAAAEDHLAPWSEIVGSLKVMVPGLMPPAATLRSWKARGERFEGSLWPKVTPAVGDPLWRGGDVFDAVVNWRTQQERRHAGDVRCA